MTRSAMSRPVALPVLAVLLSATSLTPAAEAGCVTSSGATTCTEVIDYWVYDGSGTVKSVDIRDLSEDFASDNQWPYIHLEHVVPAAEPEKKPAGG
ncbi:hypothetical protein LC092_03505 [Stappia stellulata]|uniref:hypothetical protein n=1 Tax=Stappia stellulata TaxID=71235 RepID=UPI001CD5886A|nr:hypothetical protein [Stappia stellulata]MCA1241495.1 hypothetical protein [Stappia stellulata]